MSEQERSESGDPIYRYDKKRKDWTPADMSGSSLEAISAHIEQHVGKIAIVWHEILSDLVHIDVHHVAPTPDRPYHTLVTSGMSDLPMKAPAGQEAHRYAELMICLPASWPMSQEDWKNERHYWPVRWLKMLARFPHEHDTWLWQRHTMPNGDPAQPLAENVGWTGIILDTPRTVSTDFFQLKASAEKTIHFLAVFPLYTDEMDFKLQRGAAELMARFERAKCTELVEPARRSVLTKPWWKLF